MFKSEREPNVESPDLLQGASPTWSPIRTEVQIYNAHD